MTQDVYYQFPQTPEQLRRCGARGGKATARLWRVRRDGVAAERLQPESEPEVPRETTAAAIARLDDQYPWLRGAEKRSCKQFRQ